MSGRCTEALHAHRCVPAPRRAVRLDDPVAHATVDSRLYPHGAGIEAPNGEAAGLLDREPADREPLSGRERILGVADDIHGDLRMTDRWPRPRMWLAGPDGEQLALPGSLWPAGSSLSGGGPICFAPITRRQANALLVQWEHPLGEYRRPFGYQAWGMAVDGQAVAVVVSGSTVSARVDGELHRRNVVELARIARHPEHPGAMRAMLRLWRDYLARRWPYWPVEAAISYALPGKAGNLYRFDGWQKVGARVPSGGGGTWSGVPVARGIADGRKTLFIYSYGSAM